MNVRIENIVNNFMRREDYNYDNFIGEVIDLTDDVVLLLGKRKIENYHNVYTVDYINQNGEGFDPKYFSTEDYDINSIRGMLITFISNI